MLNKYVIVKLYEKIILIEVGISSTTIYKDIFGLIIDTRLNKAAHFYLLSIENLYFNVKIDRINRATKLNYLLNNHFNDKY